MERKPHDLQQARGAFEGGRMVPGMTTVAARLEERLGFSLTTLRRWALKGGWAVVDQGLFSGANFLLNILLARWLPPEEYGAFAVALSVYYLLLNFHTAVLTEPMMVFGAGKYREHFRKYLGMLLWGHWGVSALISVGLGVAALVAGHTGSRPLAQALAGLAVAAPFLLLFWLTRRACYVEMRPLWAVVGSGVNLVLAVVGLFLFWRQGLLSPLTGLVLLGATAGGASLLNLLQLRPQVLGFIGNPTPAVVARDHQDYGGWNVLATFAYWSSTQLLTLMVSIVLGLKATAALAALAITLYRPLRLITQSVSLVILPKLSQYVKEVYLRKFHRMLRYSVFLIGIIVTGYGLLLTMFRSSITNVLYGGSYNEYLFLIPLAAIWNVGSAISGILTSGLKAQGNVKYVMSVNIVVAIATPMMAFLMMRFWGLWGAALTGVFTQPLAVFLLWRNLRAGSKNNR